VDPAELSVLTPLPLGRHTLDNRLAFIATVNNLGRNREITDAQIAYYEARARGGTGLIVTEGMSVHPTSLPNPTLPLAFDPGLIPGLRRMADAVHRHDRPIYGQLWHVGRQALWNPAEQPWSPSGERDPYSGTTPHVMSDAEILEIIAGFASSARNLQQAGFEGVELHGAHGYLINQFLSPSSNLRTDRWGGSTENRTRFVLEVIRAVRDACGDELGIGLKLTVHEYVDGGLDLAESQAIVDHLLGHVSLEYIAVSQANFSPSLEYHVADQRFPDVPFEDLARGIHDTVAGRTPVMALCKVPDVETASRLIDTGAAELVGMARALIADPDIVAKTRAGAAPRPCIYCNICWEHIHTGRPAHCVYAPETAREVELAAAAEVAPETDEPLRIAVLGAGPAGLEYARVAAGRGHQVQLREAAGEAGGRFRRDAAVPGLQSYGPAADWMVGAAVEAGAELRLGDASVPTADEVDLVVVATGAEPLVEPLAGADTVSLEAAVADPAALRDPVFVVDEIEAEPVYAAVEALAAAGRDVHLITRRATIGRRVAYVSLIGVFRRLDGAGIPIHTLLSPRRAEEGRLIASHAFSKREHDLGPVGTVVRAGPYAAHAAVVDGDVATQVIGDASAPREALVVVYEAHRRALELPRCSPARATKEEEPTHV
jgi:2,4-dienoyl-CoA reductase-like NADH-dependent reductase (Old Yellow Enzyme family)